MSHMFVVKMSIDSDEEVLCRHMYMRQLVANMLIMVYENGTIIKYKVGIKKFHRRRSTVLHAIGE